MFDVSFFVIFSLKIITKSSHSAHDPILFEEQATITEKLTIFIAEVFAMDKGVTDLRLSDAKVLGRELMAFPTLCRTYTIFGKK